MDPLNVFVTFAAANDNTVIYYDQWEDGYEASITNPTQSTTQVWGDGNAANGYPPGNPGDLIPAGSVFSLRNYVTSTTGASALKYDSRDKVASFKPITLTKTSYPTNAGTLMAGCVEVFEQGLWGTEFRVPIGSNMPTSTATATLTWDSDMFAYTALSIMAGAGGATVQIDADNNGTFETTATLAEGQTRFVTNVSVGGRVLADKPVEVVMFAGRPTSNYMSRDSSLLPVSRWSSSYYAPVSTNATYGTSVFLYNPGATAITVSYDYRSSATAYTTATVNVPAGGNARVNLTASNGTTNFGAYRFYTNGASPATFYAFCAVDGASATVGSNQAYDGGFTLVAQPSLTTQVQLSLGIGRDPYSATNPAENGNPVWITTAGNGHTAEIVYVDYNGDKAGALTDPNGNKYDVQYSLRELQQQQLIDPDGDQSGMLAYVLNPNVKIAAAWAQNPSLATAGAPGLDVSTLIPPLREGDASKGSSVVIDADGDGRCSAGDTLEYDIRMVNTARSGLNGPFTVTDNFPANLTYKAGTTKYRYSVNNAWQAWVSIPDDASGTAFPLDGVGFAVPGTINYGQQIQVVFQADIAPYASLTPVGTASITNTGSVLFTPLGLNLALNWSDPLYGSIGDRVWIDTNADGVQDGGETGLNGVVVYADLNNNGIKDTNEPTATTAGDGNYVLNGLLGGTYTVRVDPASVAALDPKYGPTYDLDGFATSYVTSVVLAAAQDRTDVDFGFRAVCSVGDRVWVDRDGDGVQESGEPGINNVRVYIDSNSNGSYNVGEPNSLTFGDGTYYIGNLAAGTYRVRVDTTTLPVGATQTFDLDGTGTANQASVTLTTAQHNPNLDFGYRGALSIGDLVWEDFNANAIKDTAEAGLANVRVYIDANGNGTWDSTEAFALTNASGIYSITNLFNGTYAVRVDTTTLPASMFQTYDLTSPVTDNQATAVLAGSSLTTLDFGYRYDATLGDRVWNDLDNDGVQDAGEPGIANVLVFIDANANGVLNPATERYVLTDVNGNYTFNNLAAGTYSVRVDTGTLPLGVTQTFDLDGTGTPNVASRTLTANEDATNVDFGYRSTASVGNYVWTDTDADGVQDVAESGINGVRVYLDINGNDVFDSATEPSSITAGNGAYLISGLVAGSYTARVDTSTLPVGVVQTYDLTGALDHAATFSLSSAQARTDLDFGYVQPAAIGNRVWLDANENGLQDGGETGLGGVLVTLYKAVDNTVAGTATTDGSGNYAFTNLLPGNYYVSFGSLSGYGLTYANRGADDAIDSDATPATGVTANYSLTAGVTDNSVDAGYFQTVTLGDRVWNDANANGVQDMGESGLGGVTVSLTRPGVGADGIAGNADDNLVVTSQLSAANGSYNFTGLPQGTYQVGFSTLAGYGRTLTDQGADDTKDSDANASNGLTANITLVVGAPEVTVDAGYFQAVTIGNFVFNDVNANGVQDGGETGLAGVLVSVYRESFGPDGITGTADDADAVATQTTVAGGAYSFTGLRPGTYQVGFGALSGYSRTLANQGADAADSDADVTSGRTGNYVLAAGATDNTIDAGYFAPVSIGNFVFSDVNANGLQDTGETGLAGVLVSVYRPGVGADGIASTADDALAVATYTTLADGSYTFAGLRPGTYQVGFGSLAGYGLTFADRGADDAKDSDAIVGTGLTGSYVLAAGASNTTVDAGYFQTVAIGDLVFNDLNANGVQDLGEGGLGGVLVSVYRRGFGLDGIAGNADDDVPVATQTTPASGAYGFVALPPGTYQLGFGALSGYSRTLADQGGDDTKDSDANVNDGLTGSYVLPAGTINSTVDAGYYAPAALGNLVFNDLNANGVQDVGETGLAGVLVSLYRPGFGADGISGNADDTAAVATQTTPAGGAYSFTGLRPGNYEVGFGTLSGYGRSLADQGADDTKDSDVNVVSGRTGIYALAAGATDNTIDAGYYQSVTIGDFVFNDANGNGQQDGGETGLAGVLVSVYRPGFGPDGITGNADDAVAVATQTTPAGGAYSFTGLPPGTYQVGFGMLAGYGRTTADQGADATDSDANASTGLTGTYVIAAGVTNTTIDAGYQAVSIGDFVWTDRNANGLQDVGETGVSGVQVQVYTAGGLPYQPRPTLGTFVDDFDPAGGLNGSDGTLAWAANWTAATAAAVVVNTGTDYEIQIADAVNSALTRSFVAPTNTDQLIISYDYRQGSGNDTVQAQWSANGTAWTTLATYTSGTAGTGSASFTVSTTAGTRFVRFIKTATTGGGGNAEFMYFDNVSIVAQAAPVTSVIATTDANGYYFFGSSAGLVGGTGYQLRVATSQTPLTNLLLTAQNQGANDAVDSDASLVTASGFATISFTAPVSGADTTLDFGFKGTASLGDRVWNDINANGVQDGGETGIDGVTVTLYNAAGNTVERTTTTAGGGLYSFDSLLGGTYYVGFGTASGFAWTLANQGSDTADSDADATTGLTGNYVLFAGTTNTSVDAGYYQPVTIGDLVFDDPNANGIRDAGELGLAGVLVSVYRPGFGADGITGTLDDAAAVATQTTLSGGAYSFTGLPPGSYQVGFGELTGYNRTLADQGADDTKDSDANAGTGRTGSYTMAAGSTNNTIDAGYYQPAVIGNQVWVDSNHNGLLDGGEAGVDNVQVQLYLAAQSPGVDTPLQSVTTSGGGFYQFSGLAPGSYLIYLPVSNFQTGAALADAPQSSLTTVTSDNRVNNDDNGSQSAIGGGVTSPLIALIAGETDATVDFGFVPNGSIGNKVFRDVNNDGNLDADEPGLVGVRMVLFAAVAGNPTGSALQTKTTDAKGDYRFDGLVAGSYVVVADVANSPVLAGYMSSTGHSSNLTLGGDFLDHGKDTPVSVGTVVNGIASVAVTLGGGTQPTNEVVANAPGPGQNGPNGDLSDNLVLDFGFTPAFSIGNRVFSDANNDGILNGADGGISGVTVKLFAADVAGAPTGSALATSITDASGYYRFDSLGLGTYVVVVDRANSANLVNRISSIGASTDTSLAGDLLDHGLDTMVSVGGVINGIASTPVAVGEAMQPITEALGSGAGANSPSGDANDNLVMDFGFTPTYSLGNRVFLDNGAGTGGVPDDGIRNGTESGIAGVVVKVFANDGSGNPTGAVRAATTTDSSGYYRFDELPAGSYVVVVDVSGSGSALTGLASSAGYSADVTLTGDLKDHGQDSPLGVGSVLPGGIASVAVTVGAGLQPVTEAVGSGVGANGPSGDASDNLAVDFGFALTFSLGNRVFWDNGVGGGVASNGTQDGSEPGIANVSVELKNSGGTVVASTTTNGSGYYRFDNVLAGVYTVFLPASNFGLTGALTGMFSSPNTVAGDIGDKGVDNSSPVSNGIVTASITLGIGLQPVGESDIGSGVGANGLNGDAYDNLTTDFGMVTAAGTCSIGSLVWHDINNNGLVDSGENGISGVSVEVWICDALGNLVSNAATTTTASDGTYVVSGLASGYYRVKIPVGQFGSGQALQTLNSSSTLRNTQHNHIDNDNNGLQAAAGQEVLSPVFSLIPGGEPVDDPNEFGLGALLDNLANGLVDANGNMTMDFGFYAPGADQAGRCSLGSLVWNDVNNNGTRDSGESGIAGVTLELYRKDGGASTYWSSTTSASDGTYFFADLPSGSDWEVRIPLANFTGGGALVGYPASSGTPVSTDNQTDGDNNGIQSGGLGTAVTSPVISLTAGSEPVDDPSGEFVTGYGQDNAASYVDANGDMTVGFGFTATYSIGNRVFLDNGAGSGGHINDGIQNGTEPGIANVSVQLRNGGGVVLATTTTDSNGYYRFDQVLAGNWSVFLPASNFAVSEPLYGLLSSSNTVVGDQGDKGVDGATPATTGIATASITFGVGLQPSGETDLGSGVGAQGPNGDASSNLQIDFGFTPTFSIGGSIYRDPDDDGEPDLDNLFEGPIKDVHMVLFAADGSGDPTGVELATAITDEHGYYRFDGLVPGTYVVVVDKEGSSSLALFLSVTGHFSDTAITGDFYEHGKDTLVTVGGVVNGVPSVPVTVGVGLQPVGEATGAGAGANGPNGDASDNLVMDFGFAPLTSIGNRVFADVNNNGIRDVGEVGIAGVSLQLFAADGTGQPTGVTLDTTSTDASGYYRFDGRPVGTYVVVVDLLNSSALSGFGSSTGASTNVRRSSDSYDHGKDTPLGVSSVLPGGIASYPVMMGKEGHIVMSEPDIASGAGANGPNTDDSDNLVMDFGFTQFGSITGTVTADADNNGSGDVAISGVTLDLIDVGTGLSIATITTNGSGAYTFSNVVPGNYKVLETQPSGYNSVSDKDGGDLDLIGDVVVVVVTGGAANTGNDFVEEQPGTITGSVLADTDNNGSGDLGLGGVTLSLVDGSGNPVLDDSSQPITTTTASDGSYSFTNLPPGAYGVRETQPSGYNSVSDKDGGNLDLIGDVAVVSVSAGATNGGNNFVEEQLGTITGSVLADTDNNNSGDAPISGVTLDLRDASTNAIVATTTTNGSGAYTFSDVAPGSYLIVETQPSGYNSVSDKDGGNLDLIGDVTVVVVTAGATNSGNNFVEEQPGAITGSVLADTNNNGSGDLGLDGVTLSLVDGSGNPVLNGSNQPITTTTASDGSYSFNNLPPGTYGVVETQPVGYISLSDKDGGDLDEIRPITLTAGVTNSANDFVEISRCPDTWADWKQLHPDQTPNGNPGGNPDADSYVNFTEFAFAMPYNGGVGSQHLDHTAWIVRKSVDFPGTLEGVFIRPKGAPLNVVYSLQYAASVGNPTVWTTLTITSGMITAVDNGDCTETVIIRDLETLTGGKNVVRIKADLYDTGVENNELTRTEYVEPEGWTRTALAGTCQTYNIPYVRESVFTGTVSSVSGQDLTFNDQNLTSLLVSGDSYYLEVTSGVNEGKRYDVSAAIGANVVLASDDAIYSASPYNNTAGAPPSTLAGDTVAIRRHWALGEIFPVTDFTASDVPATSDQVQLSINGDWTSYWLNNMGDSDPQTAIWVRVGDETLADQTGAVMPPGYGVFVTRRGAATSVLSYGEIRTNKFIRPLQSGSNLVGGGYPVNQSPTGTSGRAMTYDAGFFGSGDAKYADSIFVWKRDANVATNGYDTYFLLSSPLKWVRVGDVKLLSKNDLAFMLPDRAVFIRAKSDLPTYTIPTPWTP
ncbi:MAG: SdrD B-like domain-containing protein [Verrucomicrobiota bacterium]